MKNIKHKNTESKAVREAKRQARDLAKKDKRSYCQILDDLARSAGHGTWKELKALNPPTIGIHGDIPFLAVISFNNPANKSIWIETPDDDGWDDYDEHELIPALINNAEPVFSRWDDDRTIVFGAVSEFHARAILGCLPFDYFIEHQASFSIRTRDATLPILYDHPSVRRGKPDTWNNREYPIPFDSLECPGVMGTTQFDEWSMIAHAFGDDINKANDFANIVDISIKVHRPNTILVITSRRGSDRFDVAEYQPEDTVQIMTQRKGPDMPRHAYQGDRLDLTVYVADDLITYHMAGLSWDIVAEQIKPLSPRGTSPRNFQIHAWWTDSSDDAPIPSVVMGSPGIARDANAFDKIDQYLVSFLEGFRSLGEVSNLTRRPKQIETSRNRCLALHDQDSAPRRPDADDTSINRLAKALVTKFKSHVVYLPESSSCDPISVPIPRGKNIEQIKEQVREAYPEAIILNDMDLNSVIVKLTINNDAVEDYFENLRANSAFGHLVRSTKHCAYEGCEGTITFSTTRTKEQRVTCTQGHENVVVHKGVDR